MSAFDADLARVRVFAQLLGPHEGRRPAGSASSFVALQASRAALAQSRRPLEIFQWRASGVEPERIPSPAYR